MKSLSLTLLLWAFFLSVIHAQLGKTKTQIAEKNGWNYEAGVTDDNVNYIYYDSKFENSKGESYFRRTAFYFNDKGICYIKKIVEPIAEVNDWVKTFNKDLVRIDEMKWKDYATGVVFKIETRENIVGIISYFENDN